MSSCTPLPWQFKFTLLSNWGQIKWKFHFYSRKPSTNSSGVNKQKHQSKFLFPSHNVSSTAAAAVEWENVQGLKFDCDGWKLNGFDYFQRNEGAKEKEREWETDKSFTSISMSTSREFPQRFIVLVTLKPSFVYFATDINSLWKSSNYVYTKSSLSKQKPFRDFTATSATKVASFPCRHHNSCLILFYWHLRQTLINASAFISCHQAHDFLYKALKDNNFRFIKKKHVHSNNFFISSLSSLSSDVFHLRVIKSVDNNDKVHHRHHHVELMVLSCSCSTSKCFVCKHISSHE